MYRFPTRRRERLLLTGNVSHRLAGGSQNKKVRGGTAGSVEDSTYVMHVSDKTELALLYVRVGDKTELALLYGGRGGGGVQVI